MTAIIFALSMSVILFFASASSVRADDAPATPAAETSTTPPDTSTPPAPTTDTTTTVPTDSGTSGSTGNTTPSDASTSITTGDSTSLAATDNSANTNTASVPSDASTTISNTNDASTSNTTDAGATTGGNAASGGGAASVQTGDALAAANVINVVNTNVVNSSGIIGFLSSLFGGGFDLSQFDLSYFFGGNASSTCNLDTCGNGALNVTNNNNATVTNSMVVRASTGDNSASGNGDASVSTGNAYAAGNVANLVNSNFVDSHYMLIAINNFGDLAGDITLPNSAFFEKLFAQQSGVGGPLNVENNNAANVNNSTTADASTGGNSATSSDGSASVTTGNASSQSTTVNQVNKNVIGGTTVYMLVNVFGNWTGGIQGLPAGMAWTQTPTGIAITGNGGLGGLAAGPGCACTNPLNVTNNNTATINNNVHVYALTGNNEAQSASSSASVSTGNAYASANTVNIVNTNIIGANWMLMIFNVFGNWSGNLSFGHPDLWIGAVAETGNPTRPGSTVEYHFTVANHGDADAPNVRIKAAFDKSLLAFDPTLADTALSDQSGDTWNLGLIKKGESKDFTYAATAGSTQGPTAVPLTATVTTDATDANVKDNTDLVTILITPPNPTHVGPGAAAYTVDPKITLKKTAAVQSTQAPADVDYTIGIDNAGGEAYKSILEDKLVDASGNEIYHQTWDLETIKPGEHIDVKYTVQYKAGTQPGVYTNTATLTGRMSNKVDIYAVNMPTVVASTSIKILPTPQVLGVKTVGTCDPLITVYLKPGSKDSASVTALQTYLNDHEGAGLKISGVYDSATVAAVKAFQIKYAADILQPWGIQSPSGRVYYTTQRKINDLNCAGLADFHLQAPQITEIVSYKDRGRNAPAFAGKKSPVNQAVAPLPLPLIVDSPKPVQKPVSSAGSFIHKILPTFRIGLPFAQALSH